MRQLKVNILAKIAKILKMSQNFLTVQNLHHFRGIGLTFSANRLPSPPPQTKNLHLHLCCEMNPIFCRILYNIPKILFLEIIIQGQLLLRIGQMMHCIFNFYFSLQNVGIKKWVRSPGLRLKIFSNFWKKKYSLWVYLDPLYINVF